MRDVESTKVEVMKLKVEKPEIIVITQWTISVEKYEVVDAKYTSSV